ncbi:MAG: hypothetical protein A3C43_01665 [Candidatus Schekmanbacteria bacterium RIFCSPHIGHO2_02_FULL_38_11]|uniref:DNA 3'-5' helicase n=1 Tax=Candidatus Schekmanbacteria bacterium RIFCSPLOWO2_12_FULL_38_15 TaxID=1817883 RepID=A0A1F7SJX9_9BACT|nr:MAG: hypothetical protein A2043_00400 [Candidatus Schekmanbacteria bacterium GWA2_38_9]OGL50946.1 MAG: hypothetical protein A3H37_03540 [Candidatus Schekmanbacteria bacterium RIFCSPLOWO2_02_FULL_38_14]OGL53527.1 MAG: hypothetical protein A3G31_07525 [Candidatus Schekmanbacteria bacterium RIFCSPLOWO2_12_FULL_38_15]OGL54806.1 MAG: hypothetical protein A3C43_01665 [Candidatus Schekmanbacteria bacterium RIFCSPHIGHO2_02_FULL_38_11]
MMELLKSLNNKQREAVEQINGSILVLAGAGSGKTRVITHRIAYLKKKYEILPENVLAVTFTNKAAKEMKERVLSLTASEQFHWINTFHSTCARILRRHCKMLGFESNFVIYDSSDQLNIIKSTMSQLKVDERVLNPDSAQGYISSAKNQLKKPSDINQIFNDYLSEEVLKVYSAYQRSLKKNNAMDFDDLLMHTVELLKTNPDILDYYSEKWRHIMVDEYQDTNHAQYQLIRLLSSKHKNLCVVGDDDQSIYRWRGADISNILNFEKDFPDCLVIRLEQNYRSTKNILRAANSVIEKNFSRKGKSLWTDNIEGEKIYHATLNSECEEGLYICRKIKELCLLENRKLNDFAIFYRTNAQSRVIEDMLRRENMPYDIFGGVRFYDRKEIKDILAYMRVLSNPDDDLSFERIINTPNRGIGEATLLKIKKIAERDGISIYRASEVFLKEGKLSLKTEASLSEFLKLICGSINLQQRISVSELTEKILEETRYAEEVIGKNKEEKEGRIENLREFISAIEEFERSSEDTSLKTLLEQISLITTVDKYDGTLERVTLMTLHNAKGLEFQVIFMSGMEEGLFPHFLSSNESLEIEEERRLCYVGMTRAKERLFLTNTYRRKIYGTERMNMPSRFIREISDEFVEVDRGWPEDIEPYETDMPLQGKDECEDIYRVRRPDATLGSGRSPDPISSEESGGFFFKGSKVIHPFFGKGTVIETKGEGENQKIIVSFINAGVKKLLLKNAKLEKL